MANRKADAARIKAEREAAAALAEARRNGDGVPQDLVDGPIQLQAVLDREGPGLIDFEPGPAGNVHLPAGGDLAAAIAAAPRGAMIALATGHYVLRRKVRVEQDVTLVGAGWTATTIDLVGGFQVESGAAYRPSKP